MIQRAHSEDSRPTRPAPTPPAPTGPALETSPSPRATPTAPGRLAALTARQRDVAMLVAAGMTNRMISSHLGIAEWTVVNHLRQIMQRLECPSRLHVAIIVEREAPPKG